MARLFSVLWLCLLACAGFAQAFGRFGYNEIPTVPGLAVDREGLVAKHPSADKLRFFEAGKTWKTTGVTPLGGTVLMDNKPWCPWKIRFDLLAPGVSLYFPSGIRFAVKSTAPPYLSWTEGSVTNGVPTPDASWLLLSFRDNQPPVVFGFPGGPASLALSGTPGNWTITSKLDFKGWVRVGLPIGTKGQAANSAGALGKLALTTKSQEPLWTQMPPTLLKTDITADLAAVEATWHFDRPGAVVPMGAQFSSVGGYPIKIASQIARTAITTEEGPVDVLPTNELTIRFPAKRVPAGRCLTIGAGLMQPIGTVSPQDIPGVVDLAMECLTAGRDALTRKSAEDTFAEYLSQADTTLEPISGQKLPFDGAGTDLDLAAAQALLMQCLAATTKPASEANSLLTSVTWTQDWSSWLPACKDSEKARRAAALVAITGALCPEPERRLAAAMFQAGLAAERGIAIWKRRAGLIKSDPLLLEPVVGLRRGLYSLTWPTVESGAFSTSLLSPIRLFTEGPAVLEKRGTDLILQWPVVEPKPSILTLAGAYPIQLDAMLNLAKCETATTLGMIELRYTPDVQGVCEVKLVLPEWATMPPKAMPVPRYSEPKIGPNPR